MSWTLFTVQSREKLRGAALVLMLAVPPACSKTVPRGLAESFVMMAGAVVAGADAWEAAGL